MRQHARYLLATSRQGAEERYPTPTMAPSVLPSSAFTLPGGGPRWLGRGAPPYHSPTPPAGSPPAPACRGSGRPLRAPDPPGRVYYVRGEPRERSDTPSRPAETDLVRDGAFWRPPPAWRYGARDWRVIPCWGRARQVAPRDGAPHTTPGAPPARTREPGPRMGCTRIRRP